MGKYAFSDEQDKRREARRPTGKKKRHRIAPVGEKLSAELEIYYVLEKDFLIDNPVCQCGRIDEGTGQICQRQATEVHHKKGRGIWLNVVEFFLAVARYPCHQWINEHNKEAMALGLTLSRLKK